MKVCFHKIICRLAGLAIVAAVVLVGADADAEEKRFGQEVLEILREEGKIDDARYEELKAKEAAENAALQEAEKAAKQAAGQAPQAQVTLDSGGLKVKSKDGQFKFKIGGRLHADGTYHVGDTPGNIPPTADEPGIRRDPTDGAEIRRARLIAKATVYEDWNWVGEVDFADNEVAVKDFFVSYTGFEGLTIAVGHQKQPYSLSLEMSSNDIPFVERGVDNEQNILLDRAIGVRVDTHGENWFFATGVYGDGASPQKIGGDEGWGVTARGVLAPVIEEDKVVHLGLRTAYRRPKQNGNSGRFLDETTHMSNYRVVDTGVVSDLDSVHLYGPEAAVAIGPVWVFGEYSRADVRRNGFKNVTLESGHIAAAWSLTGESRAEKYAIKSGEFKSITPKNNFSLKNGGAGAWEVAFRYSYLNANDGGATNPGSIFGGKEHVTSTALNWYVNKNVRMMFNWNHIIDTDVSDLSSNAESTKEAKGLDIFTVRA